MVNIIFDVKKVKIFLRWNIF